MENKFGVYGEDEVMELFKNKSDLETSYKVNEIRNFDTNYQETGVYNSYDVKGYAMRDAKMIKEKYRVCTFEGAAEVHEKNISKESKNSKTKQAIIATLVALGLAASTISFVDIAKHPEDYLTTHPDFDGTPTISEIIDRTPENFGIGGR